MKKLIMLAACVMMAAGVYAQEFEFGVKGGLNFATMTNVDHAKMKPSFHLGGFAEYTINEFVGIQGEALYSRQGFFMKEGGAKKWCRYNYLNIPVLAKLYLIEGLSLDLGPQFGILLNAKERWKAGGESGTNDIKDAKNFDVSFPIGLSYKITPRFDVSARYVLGLTEVESVGDEKFKNSVIQVGVGYRF